MAPSPLRPSRPAAISVPPGRCAKLQRRGCRRPSLQYRDKVGNTTGNVDQGLCLRGGRARGKGDGNAAGHRHSAGTSMTMGQEVGIKDRAGVAGLKGDQCPIPLAPVPSTDSVVRCTSAMAEALGCCQI